MHEAQMRLLGEPGTPIPEVDPEDVKAAWKLSEDVERRQPEGRKGGVAIGTDVFESVCKPGANVRAVCFRLMHVALMCRVGQAPKSWGPDGERHDAVCRAVARVPMVWPDLENLGAGLPFNEKDFERLMGEAQ